MQFVSQQKKNKLKNQILSIKYLVQHLNVSTSTASRYLKDLRTTYPKAKKLTLIHYIDYFENLEKN